LQHYHSEAPCTLKQQGQGHCKQVNAMEMYKMRSMHTELRRYIPMRDITSTTRLERAICKPNTRIIANHDRKSGF
jgi:hypothetical protein